MTGKDYGTAEQIREDKPDASPNLLMGTEFNLSEKICENITNQPGLKIDPCVMVSDVKEFIKRLGGFSRKIKGVEGDWVNLKVIKEEAGEKLI